MVNRRSRPRPTHRRYLQKIQEAKDDELEELSLNYFNVPAGEKLAAIPNEVFNLQHLKVLDLSSNQISEIPEGISRLKNLISLDLSRNPLTEFEGLSALERAGYRLLL